MLTALIVILAAIALLLLLASTRPNVFRIQRTARIRAPAERIYPLIEDFHRWGEWSPYEKLDPNLQRTYSGPASGRGAVYEWSGNSKAGNGRMEITDTAQPDRVTIQLDFIKPFRARNVAEFRLTPRGDATEVTWEMHGQSAFMHKLLGLFFNMDKLIGRDFETGLSNLKTATER